MDHDMGYSRVGRAKQRGRGFRVNSRRFSVQRLRARFLYFIRNIFKWRSSCGHALLGSLKRRSWSRRGLVDSDPQLRKRGSSTSSSSSSDQYYCGDNNKFKSFGRSNSFYSEAIADCLEFIKRSSVSVDDERPVAQRYND